MMRNPPALGPRYWIAISIASVFGANLGDFAAHDLHLGHQRGLLPLALILVAILLFERRMRTPNEVPYWLAIVTVRTAATNLADLATHDLKLTYAWVIAGLAVLLCVLVWSRVTDGRNRLPKADMQYWVAMLVAGTLGTALGDAVSGQLGFGVAWGTLLLSALLGSLFWLRRRLMWLGVASYWVMIVAVRTTGTTMGDLLADSYGLELSTLCSGLLLAGTLLTAAPRGLWFWRSRI